MVKPTKMRNRMIFQATLQTRSKQLGSALSKDLQKKYGKKSARAIEGDSVTILRGEFKGVEKENGAISRLVRTAREQIENGMLIEIEVEDLCQIKDVVDAGVDIILFDNMEPSKIREAVDIVKEIEKNQDAGTGKAILTEASGNITIENVEEYADAGVDRISVGAITHSARVLDISFDIS